MKSFEEQRNRYFAHPENLLIVVLGDKITNTKHGCDEGDCPSQEIGLEFCS